MILDRRTFLGAASASVVAATTAAGARQEPGADPLGVRADFPVTDELTYLDSAYITPSPRSATEAATAFLEAKARRPVPLGEMLAKKEEVRRQFAELVHASPSEIGFLSATSDGENVVARALDLQSGDNVVVDELHFTTSYIVYKQLEQTRGIELRVVRARDGAVPPEAFEPHVDRRTRLISVAWVAHQNGFCHDVGALAELAHAHGAWLYADAIQAAGLVPIDVTTTPIDCFACGTYKWLLGGYGIAPFFVRQSRLDQIEPDRVGFLQLRDEHPGYQFEFYRTAQKYEYATPAFGAFYELGAGLAYLDLVGVQRIGDHAIGLAHRLRAGLVDQRLEVLTPPANPSAIVAFVNPTSPAAAADRFAANGIQVSLREAGSQIRVSPALFNTTAEIDRFLGVTAQLRG